MSLPLAFIGWTEWVFIIVLFILIFGAKRLPELARGLARSFGEFKKARREFENEFNDVKKEIGRDTMPTLDNDKHESVEKNDTSKDGE